jgi:malonate transporter
VNGVIDGFVVIGAVIAVGYLVGRIGILGPAAAQVLSRVAFFVASPALLFLTLARTDVAAVFSVGLLITAVSAVLACLLYLPVGLALRRPPSEVVLGSMASGYVNAGNLGLPLAAYALGNTADAAPVLLFQLAFLTPCFTTILDVLTTPAAGPGRAVRTAVLAPLRNPLALAAGAGIVASATGLQLPGPLLAPVELISHLAVPGMLLAFGISLCGAQRPGSDGTGPLLVTIVLLKNAVQPLAALVLGHAVGLQGHALLAVVVFAALPTAQNVFGYAVRFDRGVALTRDSALCTTLVSIPVLFLVIWLLG